MAILTEFSKPVGIYSYGCIYLITNKVNHKTYVGQTTQKNPHSRWRYHIKYFPKNPSLIQKAIRKHGIDNFDFQVLVHCTDQQILNELEDFFIEKYNALAPKGYSCMGSRDRTNIISDATREKMRASQKEASKTRKVWNKGKKMSVEHIQNMREAAKNRDWDYMKGRKPSAATVAKIADARRGKSFMSKEQYAAIGLAKRGKKQNLTMEQRQAKRDRMLGKKLSQSHCDAIGRSKTGIVSKRRIPIKCVETGTFYSCATIAAKELGILRTSIDNILCGRAKKTKQGLSFVKIGGVS